MECVRCEEEIKGLGIINDTIGFVHRRCSKTTDTNSRFFTLTKKRENILLDAINAGKDRFDALKELMLREHKLLDKFEQDKLIDIAVLLGAE